MIAVIDPAVELRIEIRAGAAAGGLGRLKQNHMLARFSQRTGGRQAGQASADHLNAHGR